MGSDTFQHKFRSFPKGASRGLGGLLGFRVKGSGFRV